jgi:DNA modification methylase
MTERLLTSLSPYGCVLNARASGSDISDTSHNPNRHPGKMLPALARQAIEAYSEPGDLVVDPMCGIGTTPVEAGDLGRRAIGVELEPRWAELATANLDHAHGGRLLTHRAPRLLSRNPTNGGRGARRGKLVHVACGAVDLILTSPPYAREIADVSTESLASGIGPLRRADTSNYSPDRRNLGHARGDAYLTAMADIYEACAAVLKPGGFLVCVTKDMRSHGALRNLSGETIALCEGAGLLYWQRIIGLLASIRDSELVMRPSFWQMLYTRRRRAQGDRTHVVAHEDVLVFRKPHAATTTAQAAHARRAA